MYIFLLDLITSLVPVVIVFFSQFSNPLHRRASLSIIYPSPLHLHRPGVGQVVGFDFRPISTFLKSLEVAVRLLATVQVSPSH